MIFLTVGTQFPFDRLVKAIDDACENGLFDEEIFAQIGDSSCKPRNFKHVKFLEKINFDSRFKDASKIISHAGIGTVTMAMNYSKPLLVLPRLARYGEIVNDHQIDIARKFAQSAYLLAAYDTDQLCQKIEELKHFVPKRRQSQVGSVVERISRFLLQVSNKDQ